MRKLIFTVALASAALFASAQIPKLGIKGGVNFANVTASSGSVSASFDNLTTFSIGAFADLKAGAISIQPGLYYTGKGFQLDNQVANETDKIKLFYLQVPVNFVYHAPIVVGNIYLGAGPFVAYGISGKSKATSGSTSVEEDITFGDGDDDIKRTEFGLQGIAGLQLKGGFLIGISYDLGLSNIANNTDEGSVKNKVFGVAIGFTF
jgi:hypothetical protein